MNITFTIITSLIFLFVLILIIAAITKKEYHVKRDIIIKSKADIVFDYIKHLKNQLNYNIFLSRDNTVNIEYEGVDGEKGFKLSWEGKKSGMGVQEIIKIQEGKQFDYELNFLKPFKGRASAKFILECLNDDEVELTWSFESGMNYPMNFLLLFLNMDKILGNDVHSGLRKLKEILEQTNR